MSGISGTVAAGNTTYNYLETSRSNNRGVDMWIGGVANSKVEYDIRPNPHVEDSKWYNKHQTDFYEQAAQQVADLAAGGALPAPPVAITVHDTDYALNAR